MLRSCVVLHRFDSNFVVYRQSHRFRKGTRNSLDSYSVDGFMRHIDDVSGDVTIIYRSLAWPGEGSPGKCTLLSSSAVTLADADRDRCVSVCGYRRIVVGGHGS